MNRALARACVGLTAGILAFGMAGCTREPPATQQSDFFPLHTEDTWVYEVAQPLRNLSTRMTVRVRGERYIQTLGRRCRLVDESYADADAAVGMLSGGAAGPEVYPVAYCRKNGFLYRALSLEYRGSELREVGLGSSEERFLPDGLSSALNWDSVTTAYDLGGGNGYGVRQMHQAVAEAAVVDVPAGRFAGCVRVDTMALHGGRRNGAYEADPIVLYYTDWYAPNVGLVRTVQSDRPDRGAPLAKIELLAYDVEGGRR
ncbi:MAG TPA: hypothetical protein VN812_05995 [Candidatus Acidoferrales bacterium]|nr:hypothetical protein [Candidatus Acidoferrales bacterium]